MNGTAQYQDVQSPAAPSVGSTEGEKRSHTARWVFLVLSILIIAGLFFRFRHNEEQAAQAKKRAAAPRVVPVTASKVERQDVPIILEGLGTVIPLRTVTVHTLVNGLLMNVFFKEGQDVKAGQPLALVDPRPFEVQLHQAQAQLAKDEASLHDATLTLDRDKALLAKRLVPPQTVDDQTAAVEEARAATLADKASIESAQLNLTYAHITAPSDATTGIRQVDPGNLVTTVDPNGIVVLTQMDPTSVVFTLSQDDLPRLQRAMTRGPVPVLVYTRDGSQPLGEGTIAFIDNQVNASTAMLRLRAQLPNPKRLLWPNQFVKARIQLETLKDVISVNSNVVQQGPDGTNYVYIVKPDNTVALQDVTVSQVSGDKSVISKGLSVGETVVEDGQFQLKPGAKVSVKQATAGSPPAGAGSEAP